MNENSRAAILNCAAKMAYEVKSLSTHKAPDSTQKIHILSDAVAFFLDELRLKRQSNEETLLAMLKETSLYSEHDYAALFITVQQNACVP